MNRCLEKRLRELRKKNSYTIEKLADMVGISKSTLDYYDNDKRMPNIELLARIANVLNVNAVYPIGMMNTTAKRGKMKTVCEFTRLFGKAVEHLSKLVKNKNYEKLEIINHLFQVLCEDYEFYCHETKNGEEPASSILGVLSCYFESLL